MSCVENQEPIWVKLAVLRRKISGHPLDCVERKQTPVNCASRSWLRQLLIFQLFMKSWYKGRFEKQSEVKEKNYSRVGLPSCRDEQLSKESLKV